MTQDNTEVRARAICASDLLAASLHAEEIPAAVERFWLVVALEIEQNIHDAATIPLPDNIAKLAEEYRRLRRVDH